MSNLPDQLQPRALCSLSDVARRVPGYEAGDDGETDEILNDLIVTESRDFVEHTNREILPIATDPRVFEISWYEVEERELYIDECHGITAVVLSQQDGTVTQALDEGAWVAQPRVRDDWQPVASLAFPSSVLGAAQIAPTMLCTVTATWGFPNVPDTVRRAVSTLVVFRYLADDASSGTQFAEAANRDEFALAAALKSALETRERFRIPQVGE